MNKEIGIGFLNLRSRSRPRMNYRIRNNIVVENALHRSWIWLLGSRSDLRRTIEIEIVFFTGAVAAPECTTGSATT